MLFEGRFANPLVLVAVALCLVLAEAGPAAAQEQTFTACYVPDVGALYLIGLPGLPTECVSDAHEEVRWTEGGATEIAPGSVRSEALAPGAITAEKIAPGEVQTRHIGQGQVVRDRLAPGSVDGSRLDVDYEQIRLAPPEVVLAPGRYARRATCPEGKRVLGGGWEGGARNIVVLESRPVSPSTWRVDYQIEGSDQGPIGLWLICADLAR